MKIGEPIGRAGGGAPLNILIVEDDVNISNLCSDWLKRAGYSVTVCRSAEQASSIIREAIYHVMLLDIGLPGKSGIEFLKELKSRNIGVEVIMTTASNAITPAIEALKQGALFYITKPFQLEELSHAVRLAADRISSHRQNTIMQKMNDYQIKIPQILWECRTMREIRRIIEKIAPSKAAVLVLGESGTGKELVARTIHRSSDRCHSPFVPVNCASFTSTLLRSELFGHEKGAFTGAENRHVGIFELADSGTIFLDEIGDIDTETQAHLLRVLESGEFRSVGGQETLRTDIRIIAATNKDLQNQIRLGKFREDLFHRISTFTVTLPPLRDRREDIRLLASYFLEIINRQVGTHKRFSDDLLQTFDTYGWPGNIRELRNKIEYLVFISPADIVTSKDLPPEFSPRSSQDERQDREPYALEEVERNHILKVLKLTDGNKRETAKLLKINEATLYRKLKQYQSDKLI